MTKKNDLGKKLNNLAVKLVDQALQDNVDLDTRLDVLKTAGSFYLGDEKLVSKKKPDEDPNNPTFDKFKTAINGFKTGEVGHG